MVALLQKRTYGDKNVSYCTHNAIMFPEHYERLESNNSLFTEIEKKDSQISIF